MSNTTKFKVCETYNMTFEPVDAWNYHCQKCQPCEPLSNKEELQIPDPMHEIIEKMGELERVKQYFSVDLHVESNGDCHISFEIDNGS